MKQGAETIIVGAGAAGSVIASRLSEDPSRSVLLLEAGPDYPFPGQLPEDLTDGGRNSMLDHDWDFRHKPHARQSLFRFPRGRVVGGSSAVNTCIALRGQPYDYDEWASLGLPEWSWEHCLPAFIRLETDQDFDDDYHGQTGPLPIRRYPDAERAPWQRAFLEACKELGFPDCPDSNAPGSYGAGPHAMNKRGGRRISAAEAYLTPAVRRRENLRILPDTMVRRVRFSGTEATGVEIERHGSHTVLPAKQVILCAGSLCTPGILLRSGIGPKTDLDRLGVEMIARNPAVGAKLLDHPGTAIFFVPRLFAGTSRHDPLIQTALRYGARGTGLHNDMLLQPGSTGPLPQFNLPIVSLMCGVGKTRSVGQIRYLTADVHAKPIIHSRIFEHPEDRRKGVEGIQLAYELSQTKPMRKMVRHLWPGPRTLRDRYRIEEWMWKASDSGYHPCGTVPMGPDDATNAATDGRGRVRGVTGLRVADASLMPTIPTSNIHLATLMIGERFGEWLKAETPD